MPVTREARKRSMAALVALLVLGGCPKRFDPRADPVAPTSNKEAEQAYHDARAKLDAGDAKDAATRFATFVEKYPNDPLVPSAKIGHARALMAMKEPKKAAQELQPMAQKTDDASSVRARYLLGIALHKAGDAAKAREILKPFVSEISGDDAIELHAMLAENAAKLGDVEDALREYHLYFEGARPAEKVYIRDRVSELVEKLSSLDAMRIYQAVPRDGVAAAYLGRRLAAERRAAGDETGARQLLDETAKARRNVGLEEARDTAKSSSGARAIGFVLPLTGKGRPLGERGLRGALLAADLVGGEGGGSAIELRVRDSGSDPARAAAAVDDLAKEGVVAIVGSPDRVEAQMSVPRAEDLGVPMLELAPDDTKRGALTFKMVRPRTAGAIALAKLALKSGAKSVAVLAPDSAYGRQMAQAFADAARAAGAKVVADLRYPETATTFIEPAKKLVAAQPDAVFVPAAAAQLALIAPQLASSGLLRMPNTKPTGKLAALYATADGLNEKFLASTAKYCQGAVLAPIFYPDPAEPRLTAFVERYRKAFGEEPSSLDALAYDAVRAARVALEKLEPGAPLRTGLAQSMARLGEAGLTGELAFAATGDRAGAPPLYLVGGDEVNLLK